MTTMLLLGAVAAGWLLQLVLAHRQAGDFRRQTAVLRPLGTVTVGSAGRRYQGGRAFVALAVDRRSRVRGALVLRGWTTFARPRHLDAAVGLSLSRLSGAGEIAGLDRLARGACRQAAVLLLEARARPAADAEGPTIPPEHPTRPVLEEAPLAAPAP